MELDLNKTLTLNYEMADHNRNDDYNFMISKPDLEYEFLFHDGKEILIEYALIAKWQMNSVSDNGTIKCTLKSINESRFIYDSLHVTNQIINDRFPIFLASNIIYTELKEQKQTNISIPFTAPDYSEQPNDFIFSLVGIGKINILVNGKITEVEALHASTDREFDNRDIWILDNPDHPLILKFETSGGDLYWTLKGINN